MVGTNQDNYIPTSKAAGILQVTDQAVLDMMRRGELQGYPVQRGSRTSYLFDRAEVEALARKRRGEAQP